MVGLILAAGALTLGGLVPILIAIIVLCILIYAVSIVLNMISLPPPIRQLVWLVIAVIVLLIILSFFGFV